MKMKKVLKCLLVAFTAWFAAHIVYTVIDGLAGGGASADAAVILGNKVNEDGTLSQRLEKRMECSLRLYEAGKVSFLIVSGGYGKEGFFEAEKMKEFLLLKGVPEDKIIVDNGGANTAATARFVQKESGKLGIKSVIAVSQYFHLTRTKMLLRKSGIKNVSGAAPAYFEIRDLYSVPREFAAYYAALLFG
jgi:vancomycin permeability regulator SanA